MDGVTQRTISRIFRAWMKAAGPMEIEVALELSEKGKITYKRLLERHGVAREHAPAVIDRLRTSLNRHFAITASRL